MEQIIILILFILLPGILRKLTQQKKSPPGKKGAPRQRPRRQERERSRAPVVLEEERDYEVYEESPAPSEPRLEAVRRSYDEVMAELDAKLRQASESVKPQVKPTVVDPMTGSSFDEEASYADESPPAWQPDDHSRDQPLRETVAPSAHPVKPTAYPVRPLSQPSTHAVDSSIVAVPAAGPPVDQFIWGDKLRRPSRQALLAAPRTRDEWRRGIVLQEILGQPRGLRGWTSVDGET